MISFGKYKDLKTLSDVYEQDPGYYHWFSKMNKEPSDHLINADKRNKQADMVLKYIKNRGAVESLKETTKFIKNTSKRALPILK